MHLLRTLLITAVAMGAGAAASSPADGARGTVHVPLARSTQRSLLGSDGFVDRAKLRMEIDLINAKYDRTLNNYLLKTGSRHASDRRTRMATKRATGSVPLKSQGDMLWTGPMKVGTPPQTIQIDFDTGSSDTIVNPEIYTPDKSSTSHKTNGTFQAQYGDGTQAQGSVYQDVLEIGGLSTGTSKAYIGRAEQEFIKNEGNSQGIGGMGFPSLSTFQGSQKPFFYSLAEAGVLDKKSFVFKLHKTEASSLTLGAAGAGATYTPVLDAAYWSIQGRINSEPIVAIIDSGTSAIMAPASYAESFFRSLDLKYQESHGFLEATYDCVSTPSVNVTFNKKTIELGEATTIGQVKEGVCLMSVVGVRNLGTDAWIFGDPLFNAASPNGITFDVDNERVGF